MENQIALNGMKYHPEIFEAFLKGAVIEVQLSSEKWTMSPRPLFNKSSSYRAKFSFVNKKVDYFGKQLTVDPEFRYITTDEDGSIVVHAEKPDSLITMWNRHSHKADCILTDQDYLGDWRLSLMEIN